MPPFDAEFMEAIAEAADADERLRFANREATAGPYFDDVSKLLPHRRAKNTSTALPWDDSEAAAAAASSGAWPAGASYDLEHRLGNSPLPVINTHSIQDLAARQASMEKAQRDVDLMLAEAKAAETPQALHLLVAKAQERHLAGKVDELRLREMFSACDFDHSDSVNNREFVKACRSNADVAAFFGLPTKM